MQINRNTGLAILLIVIGMLMLFNGFEFIFGKVMALIFPIVLIFLGVLGIKNGRRFIGWTLFIIGLISLLHKFAGLFTWIIAVGLIIFGISLLTKREYQI